MTPPCRHEDFEVRAEVTRVLDDRPEDEGGELVAFACDLRVKCAQCGEPFAWRGVPVGVSANGQPMRSADGLELCAWLVSPAELALLPAHAPPGFTAP